MLRTPKEGMWGIGLEQQTDDACQPELDSSLGHKDGKKYGGTNRRQRNLPTPTRFIYRPANAPPEISPTPKHSSRYAMAGVASEGLTIKRGIVITVTVDAPKVRPWRTVTPTRGPKDVRRGVMSVVRQHTTKAEE